METEDEKLFESLAKKHNERFKLREIYEIGQMAGIIFNKKGIKKPQPQGNKTLQPQPLPQPQKSVQLRHYDDCVVLIRCYIVKVYYNWKHYEQSFFRYKCIGQFLFLVDNILSYLLFTII